MINHDPKASVGKPHIRMMTHGRGWRCWSANHTGQGPTPKRAWMNWRYKVDEARKHQPVERYYT